MRVLILGAGGFAGRHLARELAGRGHEVVASVRPRAPGAASPPEVSGAVAVVPCDVAEPARVAAALAEASPEAVVALAGTSSPVAAAAEPAAAFRANTLGVVHLLDAIARHPRPPRALVVTSGAVYGAGRGDGAPIDEDEPLRPRGIYAASKAAADHAAAAFAERGLDVVVARPFNHTGPGQRRDFVCADFADQVAAIRDGRAVGPVRVGNLDVERDFGDVRDVVRGYALALERGRAGRAYNLCTGRATAVREILAVLGELAGVAIETRSAAERLRPDEPPRIVGSARRAADELGWVPEIPLRRTLADLLATGPAVPPAPGAA